MQHYLGIVRGGLFLIALLCVSLIIPTVTNAQTAATPTVFFCLGNESCGGDVTVSPTDTVFPSADVTITTAPEDGTTTAPIDTTEPTTGVDETTMPPSEEVTATPCPTDSTESTVSVQRWHHHHHHHRKHSFSDFLQMLIDLINKLIAQLGGTPITIPSTDPCITPEPTTEEPTVEPTTGDITTEPTTGDVTTEPTIGTQPTSALTTGGGTGTTSTVNITFYGSYDNDPQGSLGISNPVIHQTAGGVGTYSDPLTYASPAGDGAYAYGQIIYVPKVQKYFIKEDECAVSWTAPDGCGAVTMVDLYVGNPSSDQAVVDCEDSLTSGEGEIIIDPPSNLTVDATPIWNQSTGACMTLH